MNLLKRRRATPTHPVTRKTGDMAYFTCSATPGTPHTAIMRRLAWRCPACGADVTPHVRAFTAEHWAHRR